MRTRSFSAELICKKISVSVLVLTEIFVLLQFQSRKAASKYKREKELSRSAERDSRLCIEDPKIRKPFQSLDPNFLLFDGTVTFACDL